MQALSSTEFRTRIGHVYRVKRRIGHIYPLKRGAPYGGEGKAQDKVFEKQ